MKSGVNFNKIVLALKKAIEDTFDDSKWRELGYLTNTIDIIERDARLLRSLHWGDDDYPGCIFRILPQIIRINQDNLSIIEDYVGLKDWLRNHDIDLFEELYEAGDLVELDQIEEAGKHFNVLELFHHAARIRKSIPNDPALAIGSAKELLETVLKEITGKHGTKTKEDIPELLKKALKKLELDPKSISNSVPGAETIKRTISNLGQIVTGVSEIRNLYGTGHGRSRAPKIEIAHARFVVNSAITLATFLLEIWQTKIEEDLPF